MTYELALALKNAGFPQAPNQVNKTCKSCWKKDGEELVYIPTLEELIEACNVEFALKKAMFPQGAKYYVEYEEEPLEEVYIHGKTSSEAVAKLYLALKGKNNT